MVVGGASTQSRNSSDHVTMELDNSMANVKVDGHHTGVAKVAEKLQDSMGSGRGRGITMGGAPHASTPAVDPTAMAAKVAADAENAKTL